MARPKKDERGKSVSVYLSPELLAKAATVAKSPREAILKLLRECDGKPVVPVIPASALPVPGKNACRSCRVNGKPYNPRCKTCVAVGEGGDS